MSWARDALSPVLARTVPLRQRERVSETGQVNQIFINGGELLIIHSSERTPWHLFAELLAVGIDSGAHGGDEFRKVPLLDEIEIGSERPDLPRHAAGQMTAMAFVAILRRQDVLSERKGRTLRWRRNVAGDDRLAARRHARAQHQHAQQVELVRGSGVASPADGTLRMYAITARVSSSLRLPALV